MDWFLYDNLGHHDRVKESDNEKVKFTNYLFYEKNTWIIKKI